MPINTPDSILNVPGPGNKLTPAARPLSVYQGSTRADVPEAPQGNSYQQLGEALTKMGPTMNQAVAYTAEIKAQQDKAEAAQIAAEAIAKDKTVARIDELVKSGALRPGASPVLQAAVRTHLLSSAADKRSTSLQEAYWFSDEGAAVRQSNDPGVFNAFVTKHNSEFDLGALHDGSGAKVYTDLDLYKAQYVERANADTNALYKTHLSHRVSENEKETVQVAATRTTAAIEAGLDAGHSHAQIAQTVATIFRDPQTGLVTHGLPPSQQTELTVDSVIDAAIARRDIKVLDMLGSMSTADPKSFLSGTSYARPRIERARLHITQETWLEGERNRTLAERRGAGIATDPETEQRAKETRDRSEAEYTVKLKHLSQQSSALDKAAQAEPEQAAIIQHLANGSSAFHPEVVGHMRNLAQVDPAAAKEMMTFVQGQQLKQKTAADEKTTLSTYTRLRAQLSTDPSKFDRGLIVQESNRGNLTPGQVSSLFENADAASKAHAEFPILQSDLIKTMRSDIRSASMTSQLDEFGAGRLRADAATNEFTDLVLDFVKTHPTAGAYEISKAMRPEVERLSRRHNPELDLTMTQTERKSANEQLHHEQSARKADLEKSFSSSPPSGLSQDAAERDLLRSQLADRYKNKRQLEDVIDQILAKKKGN